MSKAKLIFLTVILLFMAGVLWYGLSPLFMNTVADEPLPNAGEHNAIDTPSIEQFIEQKSALTEAPPVPIVPTTLHPASGTARVVIDGDERYLRYENYKTINGPDLRVYLATDTKATEFVDLGPIKATEGNINYLIPSGTDLSKYRYALTWCEDFAVLFNSAEFSK